jgi:hypothetical protein
MKTLMKSLIVVSMTASCATSQSAGVQASETTGPRLIGCAESTPRRSTVRRTSIELRYDIDTDGRVTALRVVPNNNSKYASDATIAAAKNLALGCFYEPALRNGQPVVTTVTQWFAVEDPEVSRR